MSSRATRQVTLIHSHLSSMSYCEVPVLEWNWRAWVDLNFFFFFLLKSADGECFIEPSPKIPACKKKPLPPRLVIRVLHNFFNVRCSAMKLIRSTGPRLNLLIAKCDRSVTARISASWHGGSRSCIVTPCVTANWPLARLDCIDKRTTDRWTCEEFWTVRVRFVLIDHVCWCVCVCVGEREYVWLCVWVCVHACIDVCVHVHARVCACMHGCVGGCGCGCVHTCVHAYIMGRFKHKWRMLSNDVDQQLFSENVMGSKCCSMNVIYVKGTSTENIQRYCCFSFSYREITKIY